jgi:hypothetical protein
VRPCLKKKKKKTTQVPSLLFAIVLRVCCINREICDCLWLASFLQYKGGWSVCDKSVPSQGLREGGGEIYLEWRPSLSSLLPRHLHSRVTTLFWRLDTSGRRTVPGVLTLGVRQRNVNVAVLVCRRRVIPPHLLTLPALHCCPPGLCLPPQAPRPGVLESSELPFGPEILPNLR